MVKKAEAGAATPAFPATNLVLVERLLANFIREEVTKVGLERVVVGLSGGVDSSVSAALAARALGPEAVIGLMMPYKTSSKESLKDATTVAKATGIGTRKVEISAQVDAYFEGLGEVGNLRRGNKMARERMTVLYDVSAETSALLLGTSNKTELLLGYGTLHGDMASAINPIGDLYKTQVWELAEHLGLPKAVVSKAPSADLWVGQTDEAELGFSYREVDALLFHMVDQRLRPGELVGLGFASEFIDKIALMVQNSQFKRRLPVIAKLSERTIDLDFRYARDWGR